MGWCLGLKEAAREGRMGWCLEQQGQRGWRALILVGDARAAHVFCHKHNQAHNHDWSQPQPRLTCCACTL